MIFGIGTDIVQISRLNSWIENQKLINRFFNEKEILNDKTKQYLLEHYASRFAAKEAFVKAMGTGFLNFEMKDIFVTNDDLGKPILNIEKSALEFLKKRCENFNIHLSLSHEKDYAIAFVIIEEK